MSIASVSPEFARHAMEQGWNESAQAEVFADFLEKRHLVGDFNDFVKTELSFTPKRITEEEIEALENLNYQVLLTDKGLEWHYTPSRMEESHYMGGYFDSIQEAWLDALAHYIELHGSLDLTPAPTPRLKGTPGSYSAYLSGLSRRQLLAELGRWHLEQDNRLSDKEVRAILLGLFSSWSGNVSIRVGDATVMESYGVYYQQRADGEYVLLAEFPTELQAKCARNNFMAHLSRFLM